jgi:predicted RNA methylase
MSKTSQLDKYYTKEPIALGCINTLFYILSNPAEKLFIEPSAGAGAFLKYLPPDRRLGFDIAPEQMTEIQQLDFLTDTITNLPPKDVCVFVGNPPFGKKSKTAISFINRAFEYGSTVAFILPNQFQKWSAQSHINKNARLIYDNLLPEASFEANGKTYKLRCCFQIWTTDISLGREDFRIKNKPQTDHPDFQMWQYNCTKEAEKFFNYDWDFAVPRQGFNDYALRITDQSTCDRKKQWIFFKGNNPAITRKLLQLDFETLSRKNGGIPGFGKADVAAEYRKND